MIRWLLRPALLVLVLLLAGGLAGCYESSDVTLNMARHEKGDTYKGKTDPLMAKLEDADLQDELNARFENQTDR
ncbi:MAG TPA: hypothetical protein VK110_03685 [Salinisphaeraceae bacterium]|nr:hypothetical protein [Salinisphaeraceae bacterium]